LAKGLALSKRNLEAIGLETGIGITTFVDDAIREADPLIAQYWAGQSELAATIKAYYANKDYSELASGLFRAAMELRKVENITADGDESAEFIRATAITLARMLKNFALVLELRFGAYIDRSELKQKDIETEEGEFDFILSEDWLGLMKITESYLHMVEASENIAVQPYLNAVFSNISRAIRMMDTVSLIDRRVLVILGDEMNRRYYLRM
jgi:hypothetical protein